MTVKITRLELTPSDLRREAARTKDADAARRMLAMALVLEGVGREQAARSADGPADAARLGASLQRRGAGWAVRPPARRGAPRKLTAVQEATVAGLGARRPGPGERRRGALAAHRSAAEDRARVRRDAARAHGRQAAASARLPPALGAPAPPEGGSRGAGGA